MDVPLRSKSLEHVICKVKKETATPAVARRDNLTAVARRDNLTAVARRDNLTAVARRQYVPKVRMDGGSYAVHSIRPVVGGRNPP